MPATIDFEPEQKAAIDFEPEASKIDFEAEPAEAVDTNPVPDLSDPAAAEAFLAEARKPLLNVSSGVAEAALSTSPLLAPIYKSMSKEAQRGVAKGVANVATSLTTPESIGLVVASALQPEVAVGVFSGLGAKEAGTKLGEASVAAQQGDTEQAAQLTTEGLAATGMALAAPLHAGLSMAGAPKVDALEPSTVAKPPTIDFTPAAPRTAMESAEAKLGVLPPGAAEVGQAVQATAKKLDQVRQGFQREVTTADVKTDIVRRLDAADNEARIEGEQVGNRVRLDLPDKLDREATTFIVEANGNRGALDEMLAKVEGKDAHAQRVLDHARENWDRLAPLAERVNQLHDEQLTYERDNGLDPGEIEGYVRHAYDMDAMLGRGRPVLVSNPKGGSGVSTSFKKQRTFDTYADAIAAGFKPKSFDVADLVQSRVTMGERLVNRQKWADSFSDVTDPLEGRPIVTTLVTQQPKGTQVAPIGYVQQEIMPGMRVAVHEGYADLFGALLGKSVVQSSQVGRALLKTEALVKHGMLAVDTFHAGRMLYKELALTRSLGHDMGRSLLEYADRDLDAAVKAGEITQQAADWTRANRPDAELLISKGLNVGRVSDALYKDFASQLPIWGKVVTPTTRWIFDKLTRGAMMHSAIVELGRLKAAKPELTPDQVAGIVAKDINTYFGNIGRQGWLKSATAQDLARLIFLAPQWVEGMAKTEVGAAKQIAKIPVELAKGEGLTVGTLAKGVGTGVLASFLANQLINMASRGHPTWENEEHGHQLDAYIPQLVGDGPGFFLSPLSVFAELTHDGQRYYEDNDQTLKTVMRIVNNKASPLSHAAEVLGTGEDWAGKQLDGSWGRIWEAGKTLMPVPIPLQGAFRQNAPPGALQRQLFGSAGIKIEPAPTADSQLYNLARKFKQAQGIKDEDNGPSEYRDLNNALRKHDLKEAKVAYDKLVESKSEKTVREHYKRGIRALYTGKRSTEAAFKASLSESEQVLFEKAREEREELRGRFYEMLGDRP